MTMIPSSYPGRTTGLATLSRQDWHKDSDFVAQLYKSWQAQYADYLGEFEAQLLIDRLKLSGQLLVHHQQYTIVACIDNQKVGVASHRPLKGLSMITMLEVLNAFRGKGIGRQLVDALAQDSERLLAHVSIHRPDTQAFYATLGFKTLDRSVVEHFGHSLEFDVMVR